LDFNTFCFYKIIQLSVRTQSKTIINYQLYAVLIDAKTRCDKKQLDHNELINGKTTRNTYFQESKIV